MSSPVSLNSQALSRLYLHAVMPCLAELVASVPEAKAEAAQISGTVQMRLAEGPAVALHFQEGRIQVELGRAKDPQIDLVFLNDAHLNGYCGGEKWMVPLVPRGIFRTKDLKSFSKLSDLLEAYMKPTQEQLREAAFRRAYTRLTFTVMARGLTPLAEFDELVRLELGKLPAGIAQFKISEEKLSLWMEISPTSGRSELGNPAGQPAVILDFISVETAVLAMRNELDTQAALGRGEMSLRGMLPLADGLNVVLDRLREYLDP